MRQFENLGIGLTNNELTEKLKIEHRLDCVELIGQLTSKSNVSQCLSLQERQVISHQIDSFYNHMQCVISYSIGFVFDVEFLGKKGLRPVKNWCMLSLKFPRQKIVKGDFLKRDGDFRAWRNKIRGKIEIINGEKKPHTRLD